MDTAAHPHAMADCHTKSLPSTDRHTRALPHAYPGAYPHPITYLHIHISGRRCPDSDALPIAERHTDVHRHPHAAAHRYAQPAADVHGDGDGITYPYATACVIPSVQSTAFAIAHRYLGHRACAPNNDTQCSLALQSFTNAHTVAQPDSYAHPVAQFHTHDHAIAYFHAHGHAIAQPDPHAHTVAQFYAHGHAIAQPDPHAHTFAQPDGDCNPIAQASCHRDTKIYLWLRLDGGHLCEQKQH